MKRLQDFNMDTFQFNDHIQKKILENSYATEYDEATQEWQLYHIVKRDTQEERDPKDVFYYKILNHVTGSVLYPLESSTLKRWKNKDITNRIMLLETLYDLKQKETNHEIIEYSDISQLALDYFHKKGVFKKNRYNQFNGDNDYYFILQLLKQDKDPSLAQESKFRAIYRNELKPFIQSMIITENMETVDENNVDVEEY